jgi:hypothetical protein
MRRSRSFPSPPCVCGYFSNHVFRSAGPGAIVRVVSHRRGIRLSPLDRHLALCADSPRREAKSEAPNIANRISDRTSHMEFVWFCRERIQE